MSISNVDASGDDEAAHLSKKKLSMNLIEKHPGQGMMALVFNPVQLPCPTNNST
jgi:hypothetical protein